MSSPHSLRQQIKNQTETDISIRANEKSVSNHWPEPGTNLQWSPGWLPSWDGCLVGQKMAAKGPVPARSHGCTTASGQQSSVLRSGTRRKLRSALHNSNSGHNVVRSGIVSVTCVVDEWIKRLWALVSSMTMTERRVAAFRDVSLRANAHRSVGIAISSNNSHFYGSKRRPLFNPTGFPANVLPSLCPLRRLCPGWLFTNLFRGNTDTLSTWGADPEDHSTQKANICPSK